VILQRDPLFGLLKLAPSTAVRGLHVEQLRAIRHTDRFRSWLAGRRSGKSYAAAVWLLGGGAGELSIYCSRSLKSAKGIMLAVFAELSAKYGLNLEISYSTGTVIEPNGHIIQLFGLMDKNQADLIRGRSRLRKVFVDEAGAFTDDLLKYAVESVLQPMLLDLKGSMCVSGTPGVIPKGYFYDLAGNPGLSQPVVGRWRTNHWTYESNPHVHREDILAEAFSVNGWSPEHATFKREYGAIWCEDAEAIIYRYKTLFDHAGVPIWAKPPETGFTVMTLDFGVVDQTAWAVGRQGYDTRPHLHVLTALGKQNVDLPEIAHITRQFREKYSVNKIYADEGALGKALANNLRSQYSLPIEPVPKQHKRAKIDVVRGRLAAETLHLCEGAAPLYEEWKTLCFNDVRDDHHPRQMDDLSDVVCYLCHTPEFSAYEQERVPPTVVDINVAMKMRASQKHLRGTNMGNI
jgi:terminase large subunit-like protein